MSEKLAACPFCGGKAEIVQSHNPYVICSVCHASTPMFSWKADAVAAWNRRAENAECGWISVKERMPETEGQYLTFCKYRNGSTAVKVKLWKNFGFTSENENVSFWMELPADPEVKE